MDTSNLLLVWLTGASCDGCTIRAIGDTSAGGLEVLLTGAAPGLPGLRILHPLLSVESGSEFTDALSAAARGEAGAFGLVVEASLPDEAAAGAGFFAVLGEEAGQPVSVVTWLHRLAERAAFVIAWGDCAVWGGPHAIGNNPIGASGVATHLGWDYRSSLGLPVIHLPGCAPPNVLLATLIQLTSWMRGEGPAPQLDALNRPRLYDGVWQGAFVSWGV